MKLQKGKSSNYLNESIYLRKKAIAEMHNMSNQLYKYISTLIVDYFKAQKIAPGERFNLYLEDDEHVKGLYHELKNPIQC